MSPIRKICFQALSPCVYFFICCLTWKLAHQIM